MDPLEMVSLIARDDDMANPVGSVTTNLTGDPQVDQFLSLLSAGFQTTINSSALISSFALSIGVTAAIVVLFCFLRPLNNVVYAPRAKYADSKHTPPPMAKHPLGWVQPVLKTKEADLVDKLGLDATVFLRFARMCRNIFLVLTVIGCGVLIPVNIIGGRAKFSSSDSVTILTRLTPTALYHSDSFWAYVVVAYSFNIVICYFLWRNYRAVVMLRRRWFESSEYQHSLAARTLLLTEIPRDLRSNEGIQRLAEETCNTADVPRGSIARNVKELPELVSEHEKAVEELEKVLAKYLKNPNKMPATRPTTTVSKKDEAYEKGKKVDAIDYLTNRIKRVEAQIKEVRQSVDTRNAMNFGFASYQQIADAHTVAYAARKGGAQNTIMRLAPKPTDLIWKNLPMTAKERKWANFTSNFWVALLTVFWIAPNVFSAVFLSNLSHLGQLWKPFNESLQKHPIQWGIVQGIVPPAIQTLFFLYLPTIFRRLSSRSGDVTKTSRERHVLHKLFAFFVFNNLVIFSLFSALWTYAVAVVSASKADGDVWKAIRTTKFFTLIIYYLESMSLFWLTWLLQRNLGAAIDLAQLVNLAWGSFQRRFGSPTPRQLIRMSAPQPFQYANYYNYFLFYAIVALCYAPFQPLALPVTALYFSLDSHMKKYLLMYVFITKTESGGKYWRVVFNRFIFSAIFGNLVMALIVGVQGSSYIMLAVLAPCPILTLLFKFYCARTFDKQIEYYTTSSNAERDIHGSGREKSGKSDKVHVRFGNPVLYRPLITPMVHSKAQGLLKQIYSGRTSLDLNDDHTVSGYSDMYMNPMSSNQPGKPAKIDTNAPFELVDEHEMDFEHFKNRLDFRADAGGDGELYGRSPDTIRRGSEGSTVVGDMLSDGGSRPESRASGRGRSDSLASDRTKVGEGVQYAAGYHQPPGARRGESRGSATDSDRDMSRPPLNRGRTDWSDAGAPLVGQAARMGRSPPPNGGQQRWHGYRDESNGPTPGVGMTPGGGQEDTSYDYFRGRR